MRARRALSASLASLSVACGWCAAAQARDVVVTSFDGTPIVVHFHPAAGPAAGAPAPTVLVGTGLGVASNTSTALDISDQVGTGSLLAAGYNVLAWDPRGLGGSGGLVMFDSPDFEARDVRALVDWVAAQPEALLDAAGDPRVGMTGLSYGGAIQFVSAALDPRIDAIVPGFAWHSLATSFFKDGAVRAGWLSYVCAGGEGAALVGGLHPRGAGLQLGDMAPAMKRACLEGYAGGAVSPASRQWFADRGPGALVDRIRAPTLITQGTVDSLFGLGEAIENQDRLRANGVPVKMIWSCDGHGRCLTPYGELRHVARAALDWLARWLKREPARDTGAPFEWVADDGVWRAGPDFPLAPAGTLDAAGAGALAISPTDGALNPGLVAYAAPAAKAVELRFPAPPSERDVVGAPHVRLVYRGDAVPRATLLYAQVVDARRGRVAGVQVTPVPLVLDGAEHTVERPLEPLALRVGPASDLRLQITPETTVYAPQRSLGRVRLESVEASLPLVDATRSGRAAADAAPLRLPPRLRIAVSSRRRGDHARLLLRSRLRDRPCSGAVRFAVRAGSLRRVARATVAPSCAVRAVVRLRVRPGRLARVTALFEGNAELRPRRARGVSLRVR